MFYAFAPMEGITGREFRELHAANFPGMDRYCMPFLSPTKEHSLTARQRFELEPGPLGCGRLLPQLLTADAEDFLWAAEALAELDYPQVDLNLGCPSGTVVGKGKGAGMLRDPERLDAFLDRIFAGSPIPISVKTRLGLERPEEFDAILPVLQRYPVCELVIHPRTRRELYGGPVHMDAFDRAAARWKGPLCYNGDLFLASDVAAFAASHPGVDRVMLGRGLLADPALVCKRRGGAGSREALQSFADGLCRAYLQRMHPNQAVLPKLKELWFYLCRSFEGGEAAFKFLKKARRLEDFLAQTRRIFDTLPLREAAVPPA